MTTRFVAIGGLLTRPPFSTLFAIDPKVRDAIVADMRDRGFDASKPLDVWDSDGLIVVDGHTRLAAALARGLDEVPVYIHAFDSELSALSYALHNQRDRRNWTDLEKINAIKALDAEYRKTVGGSGNNQYTPSAIRSNQRIPHDSREIVAEIAGVSTHVVSSARAIYDDPEAIKEVEQGMSLGRAADRARERTGSKRIAAAKPPAVTNGHAEELPGAKTNWSSIKRPAINEDDPVFRAREYGSIARSNAERFEAAVTERLALAASQGIDLAALIASDRAVRQEWREAGETALRAYKAIRALTGKLS